MKVIELLNKIANGEKVPKIIEYSNVLFKYDEEYKNYESENMTGDIFSYIDGTCFDDTIKVMEIGIIEEPKKIEKISNDYYHNGQDVVNQIFKIKLNEIIDYINKQ